MVLSKKPDPCSNYPPKWFSRYLPLLLALLQRPVRIVTILLPVPSSKYTSRPIATHTPLSPCVQVAYPAPCTLASSNQPAGERNPPPRHEGREGLQIL